VVCTPAQPKCDGCPLTRDCAARRAGLQHEIPRPGKRIASAQVHEVAVVLRRRNRVLVVRRPDGGRWAGLWEFPHAEQEPLESPTAAVQRVLAGLGVKGRIEGELTTIRHSVTRFHITLICILAAWQKGVVSGSDYSETRWVEPGRLADFPISSPQRRLADKLLR